MNVIAQAQKEERPAVLFFADAAKVLEQVHWKFLKQWLRRRDFGENLQRWKGLIYSDQMAIIIN